MASNLSTIGLAFADEDAFNATMLACANDVIAGLACPAGQYRIWRSRAGAELWFHVVKTSDTDTEVLGLTPFFEGQSEVPLKITGPVRRPGDSPFEGAFYGWVAPDETGEGSYPLVFDAVDFAAREAQVWPAVRRVRLAGFTRDATAYPSEAAYYEANAAAPEPRLAAQSFIPMGLFAAAQLATGGEAEPPQAPSSTAILTGRVLDHRLFTNELTGLDFHWLLLESLEATFDIVADPALVRGEIVPGGTVEATCWLFGRLLD